MQREGVVYGLIDPRDERIRYVGRTVNPKSRHLEHVNGSDASKSRLAWLADMAQDGVKPVMQIIESCDEAEIADRERFWIAHYLALHSDLLNVNDGGNKTNRAVADRRPVENKERLNLRLHPDALTALDKLAAKLRLSRAVVIEQSLFRFAKEENISIDPQPTP